MVDLIYLIQKILKKSEAVYYTCVLRGNNDIISFMQFFECYLKLNTKTRRSWFLCARISLVWLGKVMKWNLSPWSRLLPIPPQQYFYCIYSWRNWKMFSQTKKWFSFSVYSKTNNCCKVALASLLHIFLYEPTDFSINEIFRVFMQNL